MNAKPGRFGGVDGRRLVTILPALRVPSAPPGSPAAPGAPHCRLAADAAGEEPRGSASGAARGIRQSSRRRRRCARAGVRRAGRPSSTSTTTTVTLSRPPLPSAASTSCRAALSAFCVRHQEVADAVGRELLREPVGADQQAHALLDRDRAVVGDRRLVEADRARDDVRVRVRVGLLARDLAGVDELLHDRVVDGELLEHARRRAGRRASRRC